MPPPGEKFDPSKLPDSELNPLLNPLLAANMGRWAEVYFTTPPEKRGQAIYELLRELEDNSSPQSVSPQILDNRSGSEPAKAVKSPASSPSQSTLRCNACAHGNPAGQRFCGMCGAPLPVLSDVSRRKPVESIPIAKVVLNKPEFSSGNDSVKVATETAFRRESRDVFVPAERLPQNDFPSFAVEPESLPHRYRLYLGVVLGILFAILVYMGWRGTNAFSGAGHPALSRAVPAQPQDPANSTEQPTATPGVTNNAVATNETPAANPPTSTAPAKPSASADSVKQLAANKRPSPARPAGRVEPASAKSPGAAAGQSGYEELAIAQKYLSGNLGTARNSREAAQWLWKAVGKGNLAATVALSDLYLRGDGVPKSCDQGRLLLDAAARKGEKAAAERLRNLQAFGCQ